MPQEFHVLQCFSCKTFQVHQVKKALKWACKLCGEKQSVIKVYGRGTGAECRQHVQQLNTMRGELDEAKTSAQIARPPAHQDGWEDHPQGAMVPHVQPAEDASGKWGAFIDASQTESHEDDSDVDASDALYTTDAAQFRNRKRKAKGPSHNKRVKLDPYSSRSSENSKSYRARQPTEECIISTQEDPPCFENNRSLDFSARRFSKNNYSSQGNRYYESDALDTHNGNSKWGHKDPHSFENNRRSDFSARHASSQGTKHNVSNVPNTGTGSSKWGQFVSNETPDEEDSSSEDDTWEDYQAKANTSDKAGCNSSFHSKPGAVIEKSVVPTTTKLSIWDTYLSDHNTQSSCESDSYVDQCFRESNVSDKYKKTHVQSDVSQTRSTMEKGLQGASEGVSECSSGNPDTMKQKVKSTKTSMCTVNTNAMFSLGDLSDEDLDF